MSPSIELRPASAALWLCREGARPFGAAAAAAQPVARWQMPGQLLPWRRPWLWLSPSLSVDALLRPPAGLRDAEIRLWLADLLAPALDTPPDQVVTRQCQCDSGLLLVSAVAASTLAPWLQLHGAQRPRGLRPWLSVCCDQLRPRLPRWALCLPHERGQTLLRWRDGRPQELLDSPVPGPQALVEQRGGVDDETVFLIDPLGLWPVGVALPAGVQRREIAP
ncbi:MAG: hypothetical protein IV092_02050 [Burkholderiaceae bacterium]|nr:hypothetical protein [Burkholderiaceae bacterium]